VLNIAIVGIIYEPSLVSVRRVNDLAQFKVESHGIAPTRMTDDITDVAANVCSRDLFGHD